MFHTTSIKLQFLSGVSSEKLWGPGGSAWACEQYSLRNKMADRILLNATKGKPKALSICNKELRSVPPLIGKLTSLKNVDLKNNFLTGLPPEFSSLKQVTACLKCPKCKHNSWSNLKQFCFLLSWNLLTLETTSLKIFQKFYPSCLVYRDYISSITS